MVCPRCGGGNFTVIAADRFRCNGTTIVSAVPPGIPPNVAPTPMPVDGPCGYVFTADQGAQAQRRVYAAAREHMARQRSRDSAFRARRAEGESARAAAELVAHPVERLVRTVAACVCVEPPPGPTTHGGPAFVHWETADALFPRCFNHYPAQLGLDRPSELSDAAVAEWFASYAPDHGAPPGPITWWAPPPRLLFGYRTDRYGQIYAQPRAKPAIGWRLDDLPTINPFNRVIREDGALYMGRWYWRDRALGTGGAYFGLGDLLRLATLLGIPRTNRRSIAF